MNWIPATEALPIVPPGRYPTIPREHSDFVLVFRCDPTGHWIRARIGMYCRTRDRFETTAGGTFSLPVTHWMPLPDGPPRP